MNCFDSKKLTVGISVILLCLANMLLNAAPNPNQGIALPQSSTYGKTYSAWAAAWWTWALETPASENPLTDLTGAYAAVGQEGPVWFLAGVWGAQGPVVRECTVPAGKGLFFPIVNNFAGNAGWTPQDDVAAAMQQCRDWVSGWISQVTAFSCEIDGIPVKNLAGYHEQSTLFSALLPEDNLFGMPELAAYTDWLFVDEGYYLLLSPLKRGQHTIHFMATVGENPPMDVTYYLTIK